LQQLRWIWSWKLDCSKAKCCLMVWPSRKHRCGSKAAAPTPAPALDTHQHGLWCTTLLITRPCCVFFSFLKIHVDSPRTRPICADSGGNNHWNGRYGLIPAKTSADTTETDAEIGCHHITGLHSSASCGWERERERRRRRRRRRRDKDNSCALTGKGYDLWQREQGRKLRTVDRFLNRYIGITDRDLKSQKNKKGWNLWKQ